MHTIRLRGPWTCRPLAVMLDDGTSSDAAERLRPEAATAIPGSWSAVLGETFRGRVRFVRRFGRPTGLEPETCVDLAIDGISGQWEIRLNGRTLESPERSDDGVLRFDVAPWLEFRNELQVDVFQPDPSAPAGAVGEVRLEIE